jgi:hypothetical protein
VNDMITWSPGSGAKLSAGIIAGMVLSAAGATVPAAATTDTCAFKLTAPQLITLNGGLVQVTASLKTDACDHATPNHATVCVSSPGAAGRCASAFGWQTAEVFVDPTGSNDFVSTGSGCFNYGDPTQTKCVGYGPAGNRA